jgi:ABC-type glycerol-3-phosphate transport system permease component
MWLLRLIGVWFLLLAFIAIIYDGTRILADDGAIVFTSVSEHWRAANPGSLAAAEAAVSEHIGAWFWNSVIAALIALPAWAVTGALGAGIYLLGYRRKRLEVFTN